MFGRVPMFGSILQSGLEDIRIISLNSGEKPRYATPRSKKVRGDPNPAPNFSGKKRGIPKPPPKVRVSLSKQEKEHWIAIVENNKKNQEMWKREQQKEEIKKAREDIQQLKTKKEKKQEKEQEQEQECCVCLDKNAKTIFMPCEHKCVCEFCAISLHNCPLCRSNIVEKKN